MIDIIEFRKECKNGNLKIYVDSFHIYCEDVENGERVIVGEIEKSERSEKERKVKPIEDNFEGETVMVCPNCGNFEIGKSKYCPDCGQRLDHKFSTHEDYSGV